jgi:protein phosphatase
MSITGDKHPSEVSTAELMLPEPPSRPTVRVDLGAQTHVGHVRSKNEDHYLVARLCRSVQVVQTNLPRDDDRCVSDDQGYLLVVADGMGGHAAGQRASAMAVERVEQFVLRTLKWFSTLDEREEHDLMRELRRGLERLDRRVIGEARVDRSLKGMGTTLTTAFSFGTDLFIVHVGDSRVYLYHHGQLQQITRDHTLAQAMADVGIIPAGEARSHKQRHFLTNVIGGPQPGVRAEIHKLRLAHGDRLLLCTDGLTEPVGDHFIAELLRRYPRPGDASQALIDAALSRGGPDNVTVIVAAYAITE